MGLQRGDILAWATTVWDRQIALWSFISSFIAKLRRVFNHPIQGKEAAKRLLSLHQGPRSVADYSLEICILAAESG